jgi:hypothetical protein
MGHKMNNRDKNSSLNKLSQWAVQRLSAKGAGQYAVRLVIGPNKGPGWVCPFKIHRGLKHHFRLDGDYLVHKHSSPIVEILFRNAEAKAAGLPLPFPHANERKIVLEGQLPQLRKLLYCSFPLVK